MNILLLLLLIQGSILSLLLLTRKFNHLQNRYLGIFVLMVVGFYSVELLESVYQDASHGIWIFPFVFCKFSTPILLYCYITTFTKRQSVIIKKHLLSPLILTIISSCWYYLTVEITNFETFTESIYSYSITALNIILWSIYLPLAFTKISCAKKEKNINTQYWSLFQILFILIIFSLILEILDDVNDYYHFFTNLDLFDIIDLLFLGMIYFISYKTLSQPQMFQDIEKLLPKPEPTVKYAKSNLSKNKLSDIQSQLEQLMQKEKPFLKGNLNIQELADSLGVSRQYLTQTINEKMECNYNDYINTFRIKEFKEKVNNPKFSNYTLLALALESGFNSKTSFNTIFKKHTGMTPSEYRNNPKE